jgi:hypothetical protein
MRIKPKVEFYDDSSVARAGKVKIGGKNILFPLKVLSYQKVNDFKLFNLMVAKVRNVVDSAILNEVFMSFDRQKIKILSQNPEKEYKKNMVIVGRAKGDINLIVFQWNEDTYPEEKELELLLELQFKPPYILSPPIPKRIQSSLKKDDHNDFINYLNNFFEKSESFEKKFIFGYYPIKTAKAVSEVLVRYYYYKGVNGFFVDFDGSTPLSTSSFIIRFLNAVKREFGNLDDVIIYGINASPGRTRHPDYENIKPVKDIFVFELGFNFLGETHKQKPLPEDIREKLKDKEGHHWLFEREGYGFREVIDPKISKKEEITYNWKEYLLETKHLYDLMAEGTQLVEYTSKKKYVLKKDLDTIMRVVRKVKT